MMPRISGFSLAVLLAACAVSAAHGENTPLETRIAAKHRVLESDGWGGGHRIIFDFGGRRGWVVEPVTAREDRPWCWTMQWMGAYLENTAAPAFRSFWAYRGCDLTRRERAWYTIFRMVVRRHRCLRNFETRLEGRVGDLS